MLDKILANKMTVPLVLIIAGILILAIAPVLRWIVGALLIIWGVLKLLGKK